MIEFTIGVIFGCVAYIIISDTENKKKVKKEAPFAEIICKNATVVYNQNSVGWVDLDSGMYFKLVYPKEDTNNDD